VALGALLAATSSTVLGACGADPPPAVVAPPLPVATSTAPPPPAPGWPYWQPVPVDLHVQGALPKRPLEDGRIARSEGSVALWLEAPEAVRSGVRQDGFAVWPRGEHKLRFGDFYAGLARDRVPAFITLDTLFFLAHVARDRAFADVEARVLAPAMDSLLRRLDARLAAEQKGASPDLLAGYRVARGVVSVALALETAGRGAVIPPEMVAMVDAEVARATAHEGIARSALLGLPVDYSMLGARGAFEEGDTRAGPFRAAAWLAYAPMAMVASTEQSSAAVDVGVARAETRGALLLTRLLQADVDAEAAQQWTRIARLAELAIGHPADVSPAGLLSIVRSAGLDLHDAAAIADVVRLDHARHAISHARPGAAFCLLGLRSAPDASVLEALVAPTVADRPMPSALDIGAWLGSEEARAILLEEGADAHAGFKESLDRQYTQRPATSARHSSFYLTALDGIAGYVAPSAADATFVAASSTAWKRHKLETALGAWTALRHDSLPYSRLPLGDAAPPASPPTGAPAGARAPEPLPVFIEPHPEAIARLLGLVRHMAVGLTSMSALPADASSRPVLAEIESVLATALDAAVAAANNEEPSPQVASALRLLPEKIAAIEARVASARADQVALVADVHTNDGANLALEEATGEIDDLLTVVREPRSGRLVLAVGAALAHHEFEQPSAARLSDPTWRARLAKEQPARDAFTSTFVVTEKTVRAAP